MKSAVEMLEFSIEILILDSALFLGVEIRETEKKISCRF